MGELEDRIMRRVEEVMIQRQKEANRYSFRLVVCLFAVLVVCYVVARTLLDLGVK